MKVKNKKYSIELPFNHGMGAAITWLDKNGINYTWSNTTFWDKSDGTYMQKRIKYVFADEGDAIMFALVFGVTNENFTN